MRNRTGGDGVPIRKVVVTGGGTAGWMCVNVLLARTRFDVVLVESPKVSKVGVGEALTPFFFAFLNTIGYDPVAFIKAVRGSVKLAVRFENWMGNGDVYYHPFQDGGDYIAKPEFRVSPGYNRLVSYALAKNIPLHNLATSYSLLCDHNKVPWPRNFQKDERQYRGYGSYAYHMDTHAFSETFRDRALKEGVNHVRGHVVSVDREAESGRIRSILLEDGRKVEGDFFIDCSGFRRLLISTMSPEWISYSPWLPVNRAIAFNIPYSDSRDRRRSAIPPYTLARALRAGWLWKIPLGERFGAGYVFADDFISEDEARRELEMINPDWSRVPGHTIRFEAGALRNTWIGNCVAVGLSSGFIEPLESTSIQIALTQILGVVDVLRSPFSYNPRVIEAYNRAIEAETEDIRDFIILHYATSRGDTLFWEHIRDNCRARSYPASLRDKIETAWHRTCGHNRVQSDQIRGRVFGELSHLYVMQGLGLLNPETARADFLQEFDSVERALATVGRHVRRLQTHLLQFRRQCLTHGEFLDML